jgi:ribose 5-phosphate isomerase A
VRCAQVVERLGGDVPVFITAEDWEDTAEELDDTFLGDAELW